MQVTHVGSPGDSFSKESVCSAGDLGSMPGLGKISWRRAWQPTPVFLRGESHGRRSLVGCSPRGCKESDTTERLSTARLTSGTSLGALNPCLALLSMAGQGQRQRPDARVSQPLLFAPAVPTTQRMQPTPRASWPWCCSPTTCRRC